MGVDSEGVVWYFCATIYSPRALAHSVLWFEMTGKVDTHLENFP
jgi:hypothetical protein